MEKQITMNRIFLTVLSVLCFAAASECFAAGKKKAAVSAEPRRNFRKMPIPNLVKVTEAEVDKVMECLPEKPRSYGGNIHDRKFWASYPVPGRILESAEKRLSMPVPHFTVKQFNEETKKKGKRPSVRSFYTELGRFLAVMVIAECKENKGRFIPKIEEAMDAFITGANPAFGHLFLFDRDMKRQNERGWRYEQRTVSSADYFITRRITFSNNRAILYVDQQTAKTDYNGNFATAWWVNGTQTSESEVRWMISNYCAR